ncbi:hypothetical protein RRG08_035400 [Elysia crispata]|uniref:PSI domain-containing protein n=1 Tax=Elysia crispata TaxID=231223 RepID=A0AAE0Y3E0_9GAST|nr:hypothetical protein RRG08_035400 [Elysia crispata]
MKEVVAHLVNHVRGSRQASVVALIVTKDGLASMVARYTTFLATEKANIEYQIANANRWSLTSDANLAISFSKAGANSRFKRQASNGAGGGAIDSGAINADATTNPGNGSLTLDDASVGSATSSSPASTALPPLTTTLNPPPPTQDPFQDSDIIHDWHKYYESSILKDSINNHWVELQSTPKHQTLSDGHRVAVVIPLKFTFFFYGHPVSNVTVATGGFIYMSPFLHQWLTATQYIAPLMANFDPSFAEGSSIFYKSYDSMFIVEWRDVVLKDQNSTGKFSFQAILKDDSSITFVYKTIPVAVSNISSEQHPVKIGLSDAYYNDTYLPAFNVKKRTIYEYHKVNVPTNTIMSGTVVILKSLPTCNRLNSCDTCTKHVNVSFDCRWCNKIGRCSDGLDWFRQHWDIHGCKELNLSRGDQCESTDSSTPDTAQSQTTTKLTLPSTSPTTTKSTLDTKTSKPTSDTTTTKPTSDITSTIMTSETTATETISWTVAKQNSAAGSKADFVHCDRSNDIKECPLPHGVITMTITSTSTSNPPSMVSTSEMKMGCNHTTDSSVCPLLPPPSHPLTDPLTPIFIDKCADGKCKKKEFPVAVVVVVVLAVVGLLGSMIGWVYYAYTHPTSRSGMWLMEHRPSQIKAKIKFWKSNSDSSAKYKAETEA